MVCLGFERGVAGWKAQTNPLSYGGTPRHTFLNCSATFSDIIVFVYKSWKTADTKTRFFESAKALEYQEPKVGRSQNSEKYPI